MDKIDKALERWAEDSKSLVKAIIEASQSAPEPKTTTWGDMVGTVLTPHWWQKYSIPAGTTFEAMPCGGLLCRYVPDSRVLAECDE